MAWRRRRGAGRHSSVRDARVRRRRRRRRRLDRVRSCVVVVGVGVVGVVTDERCRATLGCVDKVGQARRVSRRQHVIQLKQHGIIARETRVVRGPHEGGVDDERWRAGGDFG